MPRFNCVIVIKPGYWFRFILIDFFKHIPPLIEKYIHYTRDWIKRNWKKCERFQWVSIKTRLKLKEICNRELAYSKILFTTKVNQTKNFVWNIFFYSQNCKIRRRLICDTSCLEVEVCKENRSKSTNVCR